MTPKGREALKSRQAISGFIEVEVPKQAAPDKYDQELFELLRQKRKELADAAGVPPYVIFSDRTLLEMAAYYPMTPASLSKIFGIGTVKASRYGNIFLTLISEYCLPRHISEQPKRSQPQSKPEAPKSLGARFNEVGEAFNAGESIASLIERYAVQFGTILNHLYTFAVQDHTLRQDKSMLSYSTAVPRTAPDCDVHFQRNRLSNCSNRYSTVSMVRFPTTSSSSCAFISYPFRIIYNQDKKSTTKSPLFLYPLCVLCALCVFVVNSFLGGGVECLQPVTEKVHHLGAKPGGYPRRHPGRLARPYRSPRRRVVRPRPDDLLRPAGTVPGPYRLDVRDR